MTSRQNIKLPQEGTATNSGGESLTGSLESVCPSYSGGGNDRYESFSSPDPCLPTTDSDLPANADAKKVLVGRLLRKKKTEPTITREARVVIPRCPTPDADNQLFSLAKSANLSDTESDMSCETVASQASLSSSRFWRKRARDAPGSGSSDESAPLAKTRGRGRPPSTGKHVGLAKAKAQLNAAKAEELRLEAELELAEEVRRKRETRAAIFRKSPVLSKQGRNEPETLDLQKVVTDSLETITQVARTSGHLKGTYVRALNDAADALKVSFAEMRVRTVDEEVARLEAANARLATELEEVRKEMARLQSAVAPPTTPTTEEIVRAVMAQCGAMITSRFKSLEEIILPERRLRPPLAADKRRSPAADTPPAAPRSPRASPEVAAMDTPPPAAVSEPPPRSKAAKGAKKREAVKEKATPAPPPQHRPQPQSQPQPLPVAEDWTVVSKGKGRGKKPARKDKPPKAPNAPKATGIKGQKKKEEKPKAPKLRPPRSTAVMLTLQPDAMERGITYNKVLVEAKRRIDIKELGIEGLRFRTAATGARLLRLPGASSGDKANALASKLREALGDDVVRVSRPEKCVEIRITGLDDSATKDEVVDAVAETGGCARDSIKAGDIVRSAGRQGTVWLRCPVAAAKKIAAGRLQVGWVTVQVKILEPRTPRCFRCLEPGHVGTKCTVGIDRSELCFRCGKAGHRAAQCSDEPHCPLCDTAGKTANHRIGGKACSATPPSRRRSTKKPTSKGGPSAPSQPAPRPSREEMDTETVN